MTGFTEITLDGCCGAGGGTRGLIRAGHYVVGVDTNAKLRDSYLRSGAHEFACADILAVLQDTAFLSRFTFGSFHPPCQARSAMTHCRPGTAATYPRLIRPIQGLLDANWGGGPYVIENVEGARDELRNPVTWCMWMFGRQHYRHRLTEAGGGLVLTPPEPPAWAWRPPEGCIPAIRTRVNRTCGWPHPVPTQRAGHWKPGYFVSAAGHERKEPVRAAMEIDEAWMPDREAVAEAVPWYLGYEIAQQLAAWRAEQETAAA
jgi:DNA (cytosine-5)-methyltransferase 1